MRSQWGPSNCDPDFRAIDLELRAVRSAASRYVLERVGFLARITEVRFTRVIVPHPAKSRLNGTTAVEHDARHLADPIAALLPAVSDVVTKAAERIKNVASFVDLDCHWKVRPMADDCLRTSVDRGMRNFGHVLKDVPLQPPVVRCNDDITS